MQRIYRVLQLVFAIAWLKASCTTSQDVHSFCLSVRQMNQQCDRYEGELTTLPSYKRGKAGPRGEKGEKGSPAAVNYEKIEILVREKFEDAEERLNREIQELTEKANQLEAQVEGDNDTSGVFSLFVGEKKIEAYCDFQTDGGGWTVIQRRMDGSVDFFLGHEDYVTGFGNTSGEYWIGLENIHNIIAAKKFELRIDLEDWDGVKKVAKYSYFSIGNSSDDYRLSIAGYSGTAGDSMTAWHNGHSFSTKDHDVDVTSGNCAQLYKGAWWYSKCHASNLNGLYHEGRHESYADGVDWSAWKGHYYSLKFVEMKIRPSA